MKKTFLYALGEIFLVVIGILIAVQLNNWNANRKLAEAEIITLNRLYDDLGSDSRRFIFLDSALTYHAILCDSVIRLIETQQTLADRLNLIKILSIETFLLENNNTTYEEMINTGRMYSLSSRRLRSEIALYYRQTRKWENYSQENMDRIRAAIDNPLLKDNWTIQQKLVLGKPVFPKQYNWLNQRTSPELKAIENLSYLASSIYKENLSNYLILKKIREDLMEDLKTHLGDR